MASFSKESGDFIAMQKARLLGGVRKHFQPIYNLRHLVSRKEGFRCQDGKQIGEKIGKYLREKTY